ncbi:hypothetical protein [Marivirga lumbricoides]|uniref:hypothetical protein n=1 Tax=Marivirga lumbricoides TaxID=1046115 RepID=UPI00166E53CF
MKSLIFFLTSIFLWVPENGSEKILPIEKQTFIRIQTTEFIDRPEKVFERRNESVYTRRKIHHSVKN